MGEWKPKRREVRREGSIHYSSSSCRVARFAFVCPKSKRATKMNVPHKYSARRSKFERTHLQFRLPDPPPWRLRRRRPESSNKLRNWIFILFILGLSSTFVFEVIVDLWKCLNPSLFPSFSSSSAEIEFQEVKRTGILYGTLWERNYKCG